LWSYTITNNGVLTNHGQLITHEDGGHVFNNGTLNNDGVLSSGYVLNYGTVNNTAGDTSFIVMLNYGTINNSVGATFQTSGGGVYNTGVLTNNGVLIHNGNESSSSFEISGTVNGSGTYQQVATGGGQLPTTIVSGTLSQTAINIHGGSLTNTGTINGAVTVDQGASLNLSGSTQSGSITNAGSMQIHGTVIQAGSYTQSATGSFAVHIGGLLAGSQYDALNISGTAILDGTLDVSLMDLGGGLFAPHGGDTFDILTANTLQGSFSALNFPALLDPNQTWHIDYITDAIGTTDVIRLSVFPVPIPAAFWLFGSGLVGLLGFMRRRDK